MTKIKVLYIITSFKKSGPINQLFYIIRNLKRDLFDPVLISINNENSDEIVRRQYEKLLKCIHVPMSKMDIVFGRFSRMKEAITSIKPDVIHTLGIFPDFMIERMGYKNHILTLRDYCYVGHKDKYGFVIGTILTSLQEYVMNHCENVLTCSESLAKMYKCKNYEFSYIRNGVDVRRFSKASNSRKIELRKKFKIDQSSFVFIYSGQFVARKNQIMAITSFLKIKKSNVVLLLLGDGPELEKCKQVAREDKRVVFRGNVSNVEEYLIASDAYVSTSKSEGMPNGVLEAMATGLPVLLSNIEQHKEIFMADSEIGLLFDLQSQKDLTTKLQQFIENDKIADWGNHAHLLVNNEFSDFSMSEKYQQKYKEIVSM